METALILFFVSLLGLSLMIIRKVSILQKSGIMMRGNQGELFFDVPDLNEIKSAANLKLRRHGYIVLVQVIRVYVKSSNIADTFYKKTARGLRNFIRKRILRKKENTEGVKEVSGFLKMISDYKRKIKRIKDKVKREEGLR